MNRSAPVSARPLVPAQGRGFSRQKRLDEALAQRELQQAAEAYVARSVRVASVGGGWRAPRRGAVPDLLRAALTT